MTGAPPSSPGPGTGSPPNPRRDRAVLIILSAAALMVTYVETMIIPGLIQFAQFFGTARTPAPLPIVSWILSAYLVVGVVVTPIAGKLGDIYGKKRVLVILLTVYAIAVTFAGFTPNIGDALGMNRPNEIYLLIGVRAIQGIGVGLFPLAFAILGEAFPRDRLAGAQGLVAAMFSVGASIGLLGGAWLTQNYGWQFTYHTVIPAAVSLVILTIVLLPESRVRLNQLLDIPGASFLGTSLGLFLFGLTQGPSWGWGNSGAVAVGPVPMGVPEIFGLAALFALLFIVWETRSARPIVDFRRLAERNIWVSNVAGFLSGTAMFLLFIALVLLAEFRPPVGFGFTYLQFGFLTVPTTLSNIIAAPLVGRWIGRRGPKPIMLLGPGLVVIGALLLLEFNRYFLSLVLGPIPIFVGIIMTFIAMTNIVVVSSKPFEVGIQTGMNQTFRNLGTAIGPVVAATIVASLQASLTSFQVIFGLIAAVGAVTLLLSTLLRNFRFAADGTRIEISRPRAAGLGPPASGATDPPSSARRVG